MVKLARVSVVCVTLTFVLMVCQLEVSGVPSKKNNKNSGSGGWFSSGESNYALSKKKGSKLKTLKKAAVIGATAYGGYQVGKLAAKFGSYGHRSNWNFDQWNKWREADGFLCRTSDDCQWIDPRLYCQDYELDFQPSALWFGGDVARIVGECSCPQGMMWNNDMFQCDQSLYGLTGTVMAVVITVVIVILLLCCCGAFFLFRKFFRS